MPTSIVESAVHGCVALCSKGLDRDFVREFVYCFLLDSKHWLCVKTRETTVMFRERKEVWAAPLGLDAGYDGGVAFSPLDGGARVAVTGSGGTAVAETATGTVRGPRLDVGGRRVAWSRDGTYMAIITGDFNSVSVVSKDGEVAFTVSNESPTRELPHRRHRYSQFGIRSRSLTAEEAALLLAGDEAALTAALDDHDDGEDDGMPDDALQTDMGGICDAVFSRDGTRLIVASAWSYGLLGGATLSVVDLSDGAVVRKKIQENLHGTHESLWARVAFSPDGQRLALACDGVAAYTYDEPLGDFYEGTENPALAFLDDDAAAAGIGGAQAAALRDGVPRAPRDPKRPHRLRFGDHKARSLAFAPDGATLAVGLTDRLALLDTASYTVRHRDLYSVAPLPPSEEDEPSPPTVGEPVQLPDDGNVGPPSRTIIVVDALSATERRESRFVGAANVVLAVAFAPTSNVLAAATKSGVAVFDVASATKLYDLVLPPGDVPVDLAYRP
mmetsp:Transcript_20823/g.67043  ORF Transcript_20823/g.67043 Transcript_20823/m.67043 type:complete len:500 (+) Transcript_20823:118-1617(+)